MQKCKVSACLEKLVIKKNEPTFRDSLVPQKYLNLIYLTNQIISISIFLFLFVNIHDSKSDSIKVLFLTFVDE